MTHTANETLERFLAGIFLHDSFPVDREVERHETKKKQHAKRVGGINTWSIQGRARSLV